MKKKELAIPKIAERAGSFTTQIMVDGVRHRITKDSYEECAAAAAAIKYGAMEAAKREQKGIIRLENAINAYIDARRGSASPSTIYSYEGYKKNMFQSMMGTNIRTTTNEQWQAAVKRESVGRSPKYVANVWGMIASAIEEATGTRPKVKLPAKENNQRPFLEPEQVLQFVDAIKGDTIEIAALLALSSLRRSEIKALKWSSIDFEKNAITVAGAAVYGGKEQGLVQKKQNKTSASRRTVPLIPPLREALLAADRKSDLVVTFNGSYIYERINEICEREGLPLVGIHGLRHSFASLAYHLQIPQKITQEIGGWSDDGVMNRIYTHLAQKDIAERSKDFSNFFAPKHSK